MVNLLANVHGRVVDELFELRLSGGRGEVEGARVDGITERDLFDRRARPSSHACSEI